MTHSSRSTRSRWTLCPTIVVKQEPVSQAALRQTAVAKAEPTGQTAVAEESHSVALGAHTTSFFAPGQTAVAEETNSFPPPPASRSFPSPASYDAGVYDLR